MLSVLPHLISVKAQTLRSCRFSSAPYHSGYENALKDEVYLTDIVGYFKHSYFQSVNLPGGTKTTESFLKILTLEKYFCFKNHRCHCIAQLSNALCSKTEILTSKYLSEWFIFVFCLSSKFVHLILITSVLSLLWVGSISLCLLIS